MSSLLSKVRDRALRFRAAHGQSLEEVYTGREVLHPAEDTDTLPAIYEERDFARATACEKTTSMAEELARMRGGIRHSGPTLLYRLEDVVLRDGWLSSKGWRTHTSSRPSPALSAGRNGAATAWIERAAYASTYVGSMYFAHWIADDLTLLLVAERYAPAVSTARALWGHEPMYMDLLGLHVRPLARARFRHLIWIDNVAQNSFRAGLYRELRQRLQRSIQPPVAASTERRVMLRRGNSGAARVLVNEPQIEEVLARRGFDIVDPQQMSALEIARACAGARIVLSVEGSQLIHAFLAMAGDGAIVAMVPPFRFINHYKDLTDCVGMRYGMITGTAVDGGYRVEPEELLQLIDRVETALAIAT